ncbi:MAG: hypothetical protein KDD04_06025, partial [Sinomicrobium sp.]|nr:hypothetical protein [Sinomicrobium sp.]
MTMLKSGKTISLLMVFLFYCSIAGSHNLSISNVSIVSTNLSEQTSSVAFDISWENSWRDAINYDAVWVFIKYRASGTNDPWEHATLDPAGHLIPPGAEATVPADGMGAFIYRNANGNGTLSLVNVVLLWNYGADGVLNGANLDIRVLGVEMVYVAQGGFWIGDGETTNVYGNFEAETSGLPFQVTGENAITLGGGIPGSLGNNNREGMWGPDGGHLNGAADDFDDVTSQILPEAFPKGYNAFYCMKYEVTQEQWITFLNMVNPAAAALHANDYNFYG